MLVRSQSGRGFVLLSVLIVTILGSMVALSLLFHMKSESAAEAAVDASQQCYAAALSGVYEALRSVASMAPGSLDWQDNEASFREQLVADDGADQWFYSIYSMSRLGGNEIRFGLTDEASKLNINAASSNALETLSGVSPSIAHALLDFVDSDDETRPEGAEQSEYLALGRTNAVRNGPFETLGETLLVRGVVPVTVFGNDPGLLARLGLEPDSGQSESGGSSVSEMFDLNGLLTVDSYDRNLDSSGASRLNLNDAAAELSSLDLPDETVAFIRAMRENKQQMNHPADLLEAAVTLPNDRGENEELKSGVDKDSLAILLDRTTGTNTTRMNGLININTASAAVLATVPGMDSSTADTVVSTRRGLDAESRSTPGWLYSQGVVDAEVFKKIAPYVTARSSQFSFFVIGYGLPSGRFRVLEAHIDVAARPPAITYMREWTRLGLPFPIQNLQEGKSG